MPRLTVAERLASTDRDTNLTDLIRRTTAWDRHLVAQAVYLVGLEQDQFSANLMREQLPAIAHGHLGAAFKALERGGIIQPTGQLVPSTSPATKGHGIHVWRLTERGRRLAEESAAATLEAA